MSTLTSILNSCKVFFLLLCPLIGAEDKTLTVSTFHFPPFIIKRNSTYSGVEVELIKIIFESLGLNYRIKEPSDGFFWGRTFENGTAVGLQSLIQNGSADVAMAQIFTQGIDLNLYDVTAAYDFEDYCFLLKKPSPLNKWSSIIRPFRYQVWIGAIVVMIASCAFTVIHPKPRNGREILNLFSLTVLQSTFVKPFSPSYAVFITCFMGYSIIMAMSYSGALFTALTVDEEPPLLKTYRDLAEKFAGKVGSMSLVLGVSMGESEDEEERLLEDKYVPYFNHTKAFEQAEKGDLSMIESKTFLEYEIRSRFTNRFGETRMYVMAKCLSDSAPVSMMLTKDSRWTPVLSKKLQALFEAGIVAKLKKDEMDKVARLSVKSTGGKITENFKELSLFDLQVPFYILLICNLLCLVVFLIELIITD